MQKRKTGTKSKWGRVRSGSERKPHTSDKRLKLVQSGIFLFAAAVVVRLFLLQVVDSGFYTALASGQYKLYQELFPDRGDIFVRDLKDDVEYPAATDVDFGFVYADPRHIDDVEKTVEMLTELFGYDEARVEELTERLSDPEDPYEPIERGVREVDLKRLEDADLSGIAYVREAVRTYPEEGLGGQVIGFLGASETGPVGRYGVEGYFQETLGGAAGFLESERDAAGRFIAIGDRSFQPAVDGADILLTIDRNIQYTVCELLDAAVSRHQADSGSVVVLDPSTGAVLAMCGSPDFDPNTYNEVEDINVFNNPTIFNAWEPGSTFKSITMAAGVDSGAVTPGSTYEDTGEVKIDEYTIKNSDEQAHGVQTMTQVLESSLNTGVIHVMRETGRDTFQDYIENFGFGTYTGIELDTESAGDVSSLNKNSEVYPATASYGQGITVTPLQLAAAYAALANGGVLLEPYIVEEVRHQDGRVDTHDVRVIRQVIKEHTSRLIGAMLTSVVDSGHAQEASVPGYYIAGKTGTAQVASSTGGGYLESATITSFAGYGPVSEPKFVIVTRIDRPRTSQWASATAAPLFGDIAAYLLRYFEVPPERS